MLFYVVINLFLAIIVIYLNTLFDFYECLTLSYHPFNLNFILLHVTLMVCFKADFLLIIIIIVIPDLPTTMAVLQYYFVVGPS